MEKGDAGKGFEMVRLDEIMNRKEFIARAEAFLEQDPSRAVDMALERMQVCPDDVEARIVLGLGWYRRGERSPAFDVLMDFGRDVIRWSPAFQILSELCRERGLHDEAERFSRIYMSMNPESPEAIADLEERLRRESRTYPEMAADSVDEYAELPQAADFKTLTLADLYARQGYRELAEALLKEILAADPQNRDALERLDNLGLKTHEEVKQPPAREEAPAGESQELLFGDSAAPPFQGLFGHSIEAAMPEHGEQRAEAVAEPRKGSASLDRREAVIGTLNRWLIYLDGMKGHA